jgi:hypothetical protein
MFGFVRNLFGRREQPVPLPTSPPLLQVWAIKDGRNHFWNKAVVSDRPTTINKYDLIGPFRSEVDCEEFCDRNNKANLGRIGLYNQVQQQEQHGET